MTRRVFAALAAVGLLVAGAQFPAEAHETRRVGPYVLVVGWLHEPTYVGILNGVFLSVTDGRDGQPVGAVEQTLEVEVRHGGQAARKLRLKPIAGRPGAYVADAVPTRTGIYIFRFIGSIAQTVIDETFEAGPQRFDEVRPASELEVPPRGEATIEASDTLARVLAGLALIAGLVACGLIAAALVIARRAPPR